MIDPPAPSFLTAPDGIRLAYREVGEGRPTVLLHGFSSTATINWVAPGHAAAIAATGRRVILPDLRGHGDSDRPHDPAAYPSDVVTDDVFALLDHLGLADDGYDLGGYSLGGRTSLRAVVRGARPGRLVVAGMGLAGVTHMRGHAFAGVFGTVLADPAPAAGAFAPGSAEGRITDFIARIGADRTALRLALGTAVDTPASDMARIEVPTLVVCGDRDDPDDARALTDALPHSVFATVKGDHISAANRSDALGGAIAVFLAGRAGERHSQG
ncbi:alpha/beta fold hydrolase [Pseudonocardia sp. N23]|uniref:alpha/beta fold hydrolase n=1 Tax=Pseudonocardia sp. N23 TaxID=1987376 RepID=UPI000BFC727C|nr:alpha/beta hydrolase [Pseudonocardia sp. N23]GAY11530.1 hydrolase [Pseudonocardia sp. N23]